MTTRTLFALLAALTFATSAAAIENAGFETGDTTGWELVDHGYYWYGETFLVTTSWDEYNPWGSQYTYTAQDGDYFLRIAGYGSCMYGPNYAWQTFEMSEGQTLTGWAGFDSGDYAPYNDWAEVAIAVYDSEWTLYHEDVYAAGNYGWLPWQEWNFTAPADDEYTLVFEVANWGDCGVDSFGMFDMVSNTAPVADADGPYSATTDDVDVNFDPDSLNLGGNGQWITVYMTTDEDGDAEVTLDGSGSYDEDSDTLTYAWTVSDLDGIVATATGVAPTLTLGAGEYTVELVVNDGQVDSDAATSSIVIDLIDVEILVAEDLYINGVEGVWCDFQDPEMMCKFDRGDVGDTLVVGDAELVELTGAATGSDEIRVIDNGKLGNNNGGKGKGKGN